MKPVSALLGELWENLPDWAEKSFGRIRQALPHLPATIAFTLLAFGAGWVGGIWAVQLALPQKVGPTLGDITPGTPLNQRTTPQMSPQETPLFANKTAAPALSSEVSKPQTSSQEVSPPHNEVPPGRGNDLSRKVYLGIRGKEFRRGGVQGVRITAVFPDSPAAQAGLRAERDSVPTSARRSEANTGHIIVGANGRAIHSEADLSRLLALSSPGEIVQFLVTTVTGKSYEIIPVTLGATQVASPPSGASAEGRNQRSSPREETRQKVVEEAMFRAVNLAREEKGLRPLQEHSLLHQVARHHSEDMATRHFFGHLNPDGHDVVDRLRTQGIGSFTAVGENIFTGKKITDPPQMAIQEWLKSPDHRKNLLNPSYAAGGVGIAQGEQGTIYITQVYLVP